MVSARSSAKMFRMAFVLRRALPYRPALSRLIERSVLQKFDYSAEQIGAVGCDTRTRRVRISGKHGAALDPAHHWPEPEAFSPLQGDSQASALPYWVPTRNSTFGDCRGLFLSTPLTLALPKCLQLGIVRIFVLFLPGAALTAIVSPVGLFEIVQSFSHFKIRLEAPTAGANLPE